MLMLRTATLPIHQAAKKGPGHTVALVQYNDKNNYYKPAMEYVEDIEGIRQYGIREAMLPR